MTLSPEWAQLKELVPDQPFSGTEFYILSTDGTMPAAKVLVLAAAGDIIDPSKMDQPLDSSLEIVPYDHDVDPRMLRILLSGKEKTNATMWRVPPVSQHSPQRARTAQPLHKPLRSQTATHGCVLICLVCLASTSFFPMC